MIGLFDSACVARDMDFICIDVDVVQNGSINYPKIKLFDQNGPTFIICMHSKPNMFINLTI